ncbi:SDR family oxidoreductase [Rhodococcus pseudokoreensis]|uniref:SDR family oxidoreductase n=1 Tax=Rhodococcus pseudokoreensis TaxID=2811421 RepID=A0A974W3X5_9NOCA|nr:SDR family oxidoreductase [Rhodococcus pseudokoreensis]QSE90803.1 SDR family oxidoreductase [Rhodococcus pseudokoreensis]
MTFDGKIALIVGGSSGIGAATARQLAAAGATIVVAAPLPASEMQDLIEKIEKGGGRAEAITCDITDRASVASLFDGIIAQYGRLDVVVNSAGTYAPTPVFAPDAAVIDRLVAVNLVGAFTVSFAAAAAMRPTGGVLVNVTSTQAVLAEPDSPVYAATKAGLAHFTASLAPELRRSGIRVVAFAPGATRTPMTAALAFPENAETAAALAHLEETSSGPYGDFFLDAEDMARVIVFLSSDDARAIHATSVVADQGHTSALFGR